MTLKVTFTVEPFFFITPVPRETMHEFTNIARRGPSAVAELLNCDAFVGE